MTTTEPSKACSTCKAIKPLTNYSLDRTHTDGHRYVCKLCVSEYRKAYRLANPEKMHARDVAYYANNRDKCIASATRWQADNPDKAAVKNARYRANNPEKTLARHVVYRVNNREKEQARHATYLAKNRGKIQAKAAVYRASNRDKIATKAVAYYLNNRDKITATQVIYRANNPEKECARSARRRAAKLQATPAWSDQKKIVEIYLLSDMLTALHGVPYHVDHIYPLRGKTVCGLHVHQNLQVLPSNVNQSKSNKVCHEATGGTV